MGGLVWQYEYTLKDHLGNTRVTFADLNNSNTIDPNTEINQINHYYPFGLNMEGNWNGASADAKNKYQYNGKELQTDFGLDWNDYGARSYDAATGRFTTIDPLAESFLRWSPYQYCKDNPIKFIDPSGMMSEAYTTAFNGLTKGQEMYDAASARSQEESKSPNYKDAIKKFGKEFQTAVTEANKAGKETGYLIYMLAGKMSVSSMITGEKSEITSKQRAEAMKGLPEGSTLVGSYHVHPEALGLTDNGVTKENPISMGDLDGLLTEAANGKSQGFFEIVDAKDHRFVAELGNSQVASSFREKDIGFQTSGAQDKNGTSLDWSSQAISAQNALKGHITDKVLQSYKTNFSSGTTGINIYQSTLNNNTFKKIN